MTTFVETYTPETTPEALDGARLAAEVVELAEEVLPILYERGVVRTPLEDLSDFAPEGYTLLNKNEGLQSTGAFKIRGATAALYLELRKAEKKAIAITNVFTASDGNHGHGVRAAAAQEGLPCTVEMARTISPERQTWLTNIGAEVRAVHPTFETAKATAEYKGSLPGHIYIDPFDAVETMAGPASIGYEILADLFDQQAQGEIDLLQDDVTVSVAVAGGGKVAALASVFQDAGQRGLIGSNFRLIGTQMERSDALTRDLHGDEPLTAKTLDKTCESTALLEAGKKTKAILKQAPCFAGMTVVSKAEVGEAMLLMQGPYGLTEPAGALALAGALKFARQNGTVDNAKRHLLITVRSGSDHLTPEAFKAYVNEVDEATKQRAAEMEKARREREVEVQIAAFQALSRQALKQANSTTAGVELNAGRRKPVSLKESGVGRYAATAVGWSGLTYQHRQGLVQPTSRSWR